MLKSRDQKQSLRSKGITFDAGALVARVEGCAAGRPPVRVRAVKLPPPVKPIVAQQIRANRLAWAARQPGLPRCSACRRRRRSRGKTTPANRAAQPCACWPWPGFTPEALHAA